MGDNLCLAGENYHLTHGFHENPVSRINQFLDRLHDLNSPTLNSTKPPLHAATDLQHQPKSSR